MHNKNFRLIALLVSITLFASLVCACGGSGQQAGNAGGATTEAATSAAATTTAQATTTTTTTTSAAAATTESADAGASGNKAVTIAVRDNWPGVEYNKDSLAFWEEKTDTKLSFILMPPSEMEEKLNLLLAGGDRPDIVQFYSDAFEKKLADSDLLLPLKEVLNTKAPNLKKEFGETIWTAMTHPNGEIYAIPYMGDIYADFTTIYRQDWLDALGMAVPATMDEYVDVAIAMAKNDPDGNGINDTYAFSSHDGFRDTRQFHHIFRAYGCLPGIWMNVDGKITCCDVMPGAKEALKVINKLFVEGAIDPEFITDDEQVLGEKSQKGMYGACNYYITLFDPTFKYAVAIKEAYPNAIFTQGVEPLKTNFDAPGVGQSMLPLRGWLKTGIIKGGANPDGAIRICDWFATDVGASYYNYGVEGIDFSRDASGLVTRLVEGEAAIERSVCQYWIVCRDLNWHYPPSYKEACANVQKDAVPRAQEGLFVEEEETYKSDIDAFTKEQYALMAVGEIPIDGGFESFVEEWNARGGKILTEAYNKAAANR